MYPYLDNKKLKYFISLFPNSAYYGVEVPVDYIIADIAESCGFKVREIRKARDLKTSPQQSDKIKKLRESVIIIDY
jgi:hypothetical protein